jgi:hypothetical protein
MLVPHLSSKNRPKHLLVHPIEDRDLSYIHRGDISADYYCILCLFIPFLVISVECTYQNVRDTNPLAV